MKKLLCLACALCLLLCACTTRADVISADTVKNAETGIEYTLCGNGKGVFCRHGWNDELYMKDADGTEYYTIGKIEPEKYICDYFTDGTEELARVYHSTSAPDITMENFEPTGALIYVEGYISQYVDEFLPEDDYLHLYFTQDKIDEIVSTREAARAAAEEAGEKYIESYDYVYAIRDTILNDEVKLDYAPTSDIMDESSTFHVRMLSEKFQGLYYDVVFWRSIDGVNYLLDRTTDKSYLCPYFVAEVFVGDGT